LETLNSYGLAKKARFAHGFDLYRQIQDKVRL